MTKKFPADGMGLNSFPSVMRVVKVTIGADSDAVDAHLETTGTYDVLTVAAGSIVKFLGSHVSTAFSASYTITLGDSDDADGYAVDTDIIPGSTSVTDSLRSGVNDTGVNVTPAYVSGKYYAAEQTITAAGGGAACAAGLAELYFLVATAGLE